MGNILIKVDWERYRAVGAMLCDWDISKYKEELTMRPTELDQAVSLLYRFIGLNVSRNTHCSGHLAVQVRIVSPLPLESLRARR